MRVSVSGKIIGLQEDNIQGVAGDSQKIDTVDKNKNKNNDNKNNDNKNNDINKNDNLNTNPIIVRLRNTDKSATISPQGEFTINDVLPNDYELEIEAEQFCWQQNV